MTYSVALDTTEAKAFLDALGQRATSLRGLMQKVAYTVAQKVALCFAQQRDPWGAAWQPLAPSTIKARRDRGVSGLSILRDTGMLLGSLGSDAQGDNSATVFIGFLDRPATIHQFGGNAGRDLAAHIPARPMLPIRPGGVADLPPSWLDEIVALMSSELTESGA